MSTKLIVNYEAHEAGIIASAAVGPIKVLTAFGASAEEAKARLVEKVQSFMVMQAHVPEPEEIEIGIPYFLDLNQPELAIAV
jgi:hypothetical protein